MTFGAGKAGHQGTAVFALRSRTLTLLLCFFLFFLTMLMHEPKAWHVSNARGQCNNAYIDFEFMASNAVLLKSLLAASLKLSLASAACVCMVLCGVAVGGWWSVNAVLLVAGCWDGGRGTGTRC